jgi:SAM-dependent methyltransferase
VAEWLPALDGVVEKLKHGALVADVGCGHGHSTVLMAAAFERSSFVGFDTHDESLEAARANSEAAGVAERVDFQRADAASLPGSKYDLICFFDCLHDLGDPVGAARRALESLADDGAVIVVEPFAGDAVPENRGPVARMYYAGSTVLCLPHSRSEEVGLALGAQAGPARLAAVLEEARLRFRPDRAPDAVQHGSRGAPLIWSSAAFSSSSTTGTPPSRRMPASRCLPHRATRAS